MLHRRLLIALALGLAVGLLSGCPTKKPKYPACNSEKDCKDGQKCVQKTCVQCSESSDCGDGETCEAGACVAEKEPACTSHEQCEPGQVCEDGECRACQKSGECGPGGTCEQGACKRPKACTVDTDCEDDQDCVKGLCLRPWQGSKPDEVSCQLETIFFQFDEAALPEGQRNLLNQNAECILQAPADRGVYVFGHADETGTEEYNIALSERRARSVADYMARLGIDPARLNVVPKGESEPSGQGVGRDRRVEFEWR